MNKMKQMMKRKMIPNQSKDTRCNRWNRVGCLVCAALVVLGVQAQWSGASTVDAITGATEVDTTSDTSTDTTSVVDTLAADASSQKLREDTVATDYHKVVEQAMALTLQDSLTQAETLFKKALKMDPVNARNALLFSNLGTVQKRLGKVDEAIQSYTMALNITPYATAILLNRAALYLDKGNTDKAYIDYCNVLDLLPENIEARLFRAYIYMNRRQYDEARVDYNVVLGKEPTHKPARIGIILLDQYVGKIESAHNGLNLLVNDYPNDVSLLRMRANLEIEEKLLDVALADLETAGKLEPDNSEIYCQIGEVNLKLNRKDDALKAFEKAILLGVPRAALHDQLKACK